MRTAFQHQPDSEFYSFSHCAVQKWSLFESKMPKSSQCLLTSFLQFQWLAASINGVNFVHYTGIHEINQSSYHRTLFLLAQECLGELKELRSLQPSLKRTSR